MYSDYFDIPDDLSGEKQGDEINSDESMDNDFQDKDSSDSEKREDLSSALGLPDDDIAPKSTLERQQEKVWRFFHCLSVVNQLGHESRLLIKSYSHFSQQVKKQITVMEDSNVAAKSWQLTGEISASNRPSNSLLEEVLQFDHTTAGGKIAYLCL